MAASLETQEVANWITERESIRTSRMLGKPKPWTSDPILQAFRFCNVRREHDTTTMWIAKHWRNPHPQSPMLVRAMVLARTVNWPPTLALIGWPDPWAEDHIIKTINEASRRGKAWGSAYIVSTNGRAINKALYVVREVCGKVPATTLPPQAARSLVDAYRWLRGFNGIGSFMAGQIIADLKNTPGHPLQDAPDWGTWACEGPGSIRGLRRYFKGRLQPKTFEHALEQMALEVGDLLPPSLGTIHMQDWQNVMCEMDKWWRVKDGRGRPKARYSPNPAFPGIVRRR